MKYSTPVIRLLALVLLTSPFIPDVLGDDSPATERLRKQGEQFPEKVIEVAEGVYTAVGYSVSNVSMIVGEDGVIIIDTGMDMPRATKIAEQFQKTDRPSRLDGGTTRSLSFCHSHSSFLQPRSCCCENGLG